MATFKMDSSAIAMFALEIPKGTTLFKGSVDGQFDFSSNNPCWFAFDLTTAKLYGKSVKKFRLNKTIRVINISSVYFADQVNILDIDPSEKQNVLATLGYPDIIEQQRIMDIHVPKRHQPLNICNTKPELVSKLKYFGSFSRYSGKNLDFDMVSTMIRIYGGHVDGYAQPVDTPSCWHGVFPQELCIFNISKAALVPMDVKTGRGFEISYTPRPDPTPEEWQSVMCETLRKTGATKRQISQYKRTGELPV